MITLKKIKAFVLQSPTREARLIAFATVAVIVILSSLYYLYTYRSLVVSNSSANQSNTVVIHSPADLQTAIDSLDTTDLSPIDTTLSQNDADAAQF